MWSACRTTKTTFLNWTWSGLRRAPGKVVDVCVVLTGGAKGVVIYCGGVTNGNATTAEEVVHELGDVVDVTTQ